MRVMVLIALMALGAGPAAAQTDKAACSRALEMVTQLTATYRGVLDALNALPVNSVVATLQGEERALATKMADAHQSVRPVLTQYVESLEDLNYALQKCRR